MNEADVDKCRRQFLGGLAATAAATGAASADAGTLQPGWGGSTLRDMMGDFFQDHYQRMTPDEIDAALARIERNAKRKFGVDISCEDTKPIPGVKFGYALNISKCKGYRDCVAACIRENNQGRDSQVQYIRVLEMNQGTMNLETAEHYYDPATVPVKGKFYMPVQCMQCENPPCVKACPVKATWKEADGIVVIDYNWCIGCRFCVVACPYEARHFNWTAPLVPPDRINPNQGYLSNRPRMKGVVEKCTFCLHRTRKGRMPACLEACPTGARKFGNLNDPNSEIRKIIETKRVFVLKEELATLPRFYYFFN